MNKQVLRVALAIGFATGGAFFPAPQAHAALVSDARIEEQRQVVVIHANDALREEVKLVQLILIQTLERRIDQIRDRIEN